MKPIILLHRASILLMSVFFIGRSALGLTLSGVPDDVTLACGDSVPAPPVVTAVGGCGDRAGGSLPDGLVLYYPFDTDQGATVADASGYHRTGTVHRATWTPSGARGGAMRFDGTNHFITASDAGLPAGNAARTFALWIRLDRIYENDSTEYFSYGTRSFNQLASLGFDWRNNRDQFNFSQWGGVFLSAQKMDQTGVWYHVVYTYDGAGQHRFYINGQASNGLNELRGGLNTVLGGTLQLGGHPMNASSLGPDPGYLDEVMIFNRALSADEAAALHAGGGATPQEDMVLHYQFNNADNLAKDSGPRAQHGTTSGVTYSPAGIEGGAAYFNGAAEIAIPNLVGVDRATSLTWCAWVNLTPGQNGLYGIMGATMSADESMYLVHDARGGTTRAYVVPASRSEERIAEATNVVGAGIWQHLAGTYDGSTIRLYVDGDLVAEESFAEPEPIRSNNVTFAIGDAAAGRGWKLVGALDDVRIYPRALSANELHGVYQAGAPVEITFAETSSTGDCPRTITRVWTATDACGATISATQTITVLANDVDSDGDGLLDSEEEKLGTNPNKADTDGDGRSDGVEVDRGTNPLVFDVFPYFVRNDFDGDTISDLGVYDHTSGTWHLMQSRDGYRSAQFGYFGTTPVPGDYDGDRKADLAIYDPANSTWYLNGSAGKTTVAQWGFRGTVPVPADYDGDGRTDLAVYHSRLGFYLVNGSKRGPFYKRVFLPGGQPVVGDFDGDGRTDFAVYQPSSAKWKIQLQSGGAANRTFGDTYARGLATDYDGDGKADLATFHAPTGWWTIQGSKMGAFKVAMPQGAGGLPVTGDYNGNNKAEAVVYLPLTAEWIFSGKSAGQVVRIQFGGPSSVPLGAGP